MNVNKIVDRIWIFLIIALIAAAVMYFIREGNPKKQRLKKERLPEEIYGSNKTGYTDAVMYL